MRGPDKGPPQPVETTEFSKLVILLCRTPESTSALTRSSMPASLLHLHPYLPRISESMATKVRALQTWNSNSTFFQNTNRGKGGTTLSYNGSVLGAHTQGRAGFPQLVGTQPCTAEGALARALPLLPPALQLYAKKKKKSWPWFPLSSFV